MIIRVWGIVNSTEVEFTPIENRPDYWEGLAPRVPGLQEIEIWAENDKGARGHLHCSVQIHYDVRTHARLVLLPYYVQLAGQYQSELMMSNFTAALYQCREVAG